MRDQEFEFRKIPAGLQFWGGIPDFEVPGRLWVWGDPEGEHYTVVERLTDTRWFFGCYNWDEVNDWFLEECTIIILDSRVRPKDLPGVVHELGRELLEGNKVTLDSDLYRPELPPLEPGPKLVIDPFGGDLLLIGKAPEMWAQYKGLLKFRAMKKRK